MNCKEAKNKIKKNHWKPNNLFTQMEENNVFLLLLHRKKSKIIIQTKQIRFMLFISL